MNVKIIVVQVAKSASRLALYMMREEMKDDDDKMVVQVKEKPRKNTKKFNLSSNNLPKLQLYD